MGTTHRTVPEEADPAPGTASDDSIARLLHDSLKVLDENEELPDIAKRLAERERELDDAFEIEWAHGIMRWVKAKLKASHSGNDKWRYKVYRERCKRPVISAEEIRRKLGLKVGTQQIEAAYKMVQQDSMRLLEERVREELNTTNIALIEKEMELIKSRAGFELPRRLGG